MFVLYDISVTCIGVYIDILVLLIYALLTCLHNNERLRRLSDSYRQ